MKKFAFLALIALLFVACSKEQRQSRKLDGTWELQSYNGKAPESGESETIVFNKDKKGKGDGTYTYVSGGDSGSFKFTYQVADDKLTLFVDSFGNIFTIKELKNKDLTLADSDGTLSVYKQK